MVDRDCRRARVPLSLRMWASAVLGIMEVNGIKGITRQWKSISRIIPSIMNFTLSRKPCRVLSLVMPVMLGQLLILLSLKFLTSKAGRAAEFTDTHAKFSLVRRGGHRVSVESRSA